jgi:hypothetical protein
MNPYQTMTFGIMSFLTNEDITADILTPGQTTELLKKMPKFDYVEPELVRFYKDMVIDNLKRKKPSRWFWRWCFPGKKTSSFSKEYQAMHYGIIAFVSNKEITNDILTSAQVSQLLKKIPMYEEPETQANFYKELIEYNIRKTIRKQIIQKKWWFHKNTDEKIEEYTFHNNINVSVSRASDISTSS